MSAEPSGADGRPSPGSGRAQVPELSTRPWLARVLAGFLLACLVWLLVRFTADTVFGPDYSLMSHVVRAVATCLLVLVGLVALLRWERTRPSDYGFAVRPGMWWALAVGAVSYLVPFVLAASVVLALNLVRIDVTGTPVALVSQCLLILVLVILYEAIPEELIFRGYLYRVLLERLPVWAAIVVQAVLFCASGILIGAAASLDRILLLFVFALVLGHLRHITGTVFTTIGFHAMFQLFAQWSLGEQWITLTVTDPVGWFSIAALGIVPFALAPAVAGIMDRLRAQPR